MKGSTSHQWQIPQTNLVIWKKSTTTANGLFKLQGTGTWNGTGNRTSTIGPGPCPRVNISAQYMLEPIDPSPVPGPSRGPIPCGVSIP